MHSRDLKVLHSGSEIDLQPLSKTVHAPEYFPRESEGPNEILAVD
jgi:hypothetical protein